MDCGKLCPDVVLRQYPTIPSKPDLKYQNKTFYILRNNSN